MTRTEKLRRHCTESGLKKRYVAERQLGVTPSELSLLLRIDFEQLISRIDALPSPRPAQQQQKRAS